MKPVAEGKVKYSTPGLDESMATVLITLRSELLRETKRKRFQRPTFNHIFENKMPSVT